MKFLDIYRTIGCTTQAEVFRYLISNLKESNTYWNYFVNWNKVFGNVRDIELNLNILNYLVGKKDFDDEFKYILKKEPAALSVIPVLLACRDKSFNILTKYDGKSLKYENFCFTNGKAVDDKAIEKALKFVKGTGLSKLFTDEKIKNVVDYVTGVEVGLDSNGRKNRGGTTMEQIIEVFLKKLCDENDYGYIKEATVVKIKRVTDIKVPVDKSSRSYDFAVYKNKKICLIETNFYGGGGSKLKATAGEYRSLYDYLNRSGHPFIWITDGLGWKTTSRPLEETFNHIDYLLNLSMVEKGILTKILKSNL